MSIAKERLPKYTPDYVLDEVNYYFNKIENGKNDSNTLTNAIALTRLAKVANRISNEEANNIISEINKIKD